MAQIIDRTTTTTTSYCKQQKPPRRGCFLDCFGGSGGGSPETERALEKRETSPNMKKTRTLWFSWSKLKNKSSPIKTVPLDGSTAEVKVHPKKGSIFLIKSSKKLCKDQTSESVTEKIIQDKPNKTKYDNVQEIILENSKSTKEGLDSTKKATCKKGISGIRKCTSQKSISSPTSPEDKLVVSRGKVGLAHSASMPPPPRKKTVTISGGNSKVNTEEKTSQKKTDVGSSRFDQFIGISIIMVTLLIMVFCGKICAILCTSAWFYFYPLVRGKLEPKFDQENGRKSGDEIDFNSQAYKKKVVLEGFLERNHRIH